MVVSLSGQRGAHVLKSVILQLLLIGNASVIIQNHEMAGNHAPERLLRQDPVQI